MNRNELEKIVDNLDTVFRGDAWHGPSVMEFINSMPINVVDVKKAYSKHTICQIIYHLGVWRKFVLEKLNGNIRFDLVSDEENYGSEDEITKENWQNLVEQLKNNQRELLSKLDEFDDELLVKLVPGQDYDYYKLLTGLIQHDTYHLGMIWVLWE
ncbi:DinB family protein [Emticicia sp. BO119]|uniref:DinB family protein n=1 Tax=Emticicia sp. BO119 TaxID=2757768 RepID=UPI0015F0CCC9|nr:DinB family protein [Emticicia sp. BO119]MBA4853534.1 DinB family protein [Emticicia sp. BO119]